MAVTTDETPTYLESRKLNGGCVECHYNKGTDEEGESPLWCTGSKKRIEGEAHYMYVRENGIVKFVMFE